MSLRLVPNKRKIVESVLFIIEQADGGRPCPTQYDIVKSIFVADLAHLKKYGRPVTYDNYSALQFGPVPSETYDMLKPDYDAADLHEAVWPPWDREHAPDISNTTFRFSNPKRLANRRKLSQTDMEELSSAYEIVMQLGFAGTRDWTHEHPAYKSAWSKRGFYRSVQMNYTQLVEGEDEELVSDLVFASNSR